MKKNRVIATLVVTVIAITSIVLVYRSFQTEEIELVDRSFLVETLKISPATEITELIPAEIPTSADKPVWVEATEAITQAPTALAPKAVVETTAEAGNEYEGLDFSRYYYDHSNEAWVYADSVNVYRYPNTSSKVLKTVNSKATINIIGKFEVDKNGWYIVSADDSIGFIPVKAGSYPSVIEKGDFVKSSDVAKSALLGTGKTVSSSSTSDNRANNLAVSSASTSIVVPNGAVFSLNQATGPRTVDAGYKKASIFQNGTVTTGLGGGVCQTSTTIHCAVLDAIENGYDLEVLEASKHSLDVTYVDSTKKEAMVNWGTNDFRFVNNSGKDIALVVTSDWQTVNAEIYFVA